MFILGYFWSLNQHLISLIAKNIYEKYCSVIKVFKNHYIKVQKKILMIFDF